MFDDPSPFVKNLYTSTMFINLLFLTSNLISKCSLSRLASHLTLSCSINPVALLFEGITDNNLLVFS